MRSLLFCGFVRVLNYVHLRNIYRSTGVGRVTREFAEHLAAHPAVEQEILADPGDFREIVPKVGAPWTEFRYHFLRHETSRQQALWFLNDAPPAESFWPEAEIVYCSAESYVPVRRARLVVTCHDMQLFEPGAYPLSRWLVQQRAKWWLLFRRLSERVHLLATISEFSAQRIAHYFPALRDRIRVVPNAVSEAFFRPVQSGGLAALARLGLTDAPFVMLPGGLHFRKNAPLVLRAWPEIHRRRPELKLVVAGHNSLAFAEQAKALPGVVLAGFLDEPEFVALYSAAELVWFPSRYEGFGMPVLEAMACGTAVVASEATSIPEIAGGAAAALLSPDRPGEHAEAILALLQDDRALHAAGERGQRRAAEFTWQRSTERLVQEFARLL